MARKHKGVEATPVEAAALAKLVSDSMRGYEDAGLDAVSVDWGKTAAVSGKVTGFDIMLIKDKHRRVMLLSSEGKTLMVWESAALRRLFESVHIGDEVSIVLTGSVDTGSPSEMRTFKAGIKRAPGATVGAPRRPTTPKPAAAGAGDDIPF